jgi:hypothetical protein
MVTDNQNLMAWQRAWHVVVIPNLQPALPESIGAGTLLQSSHLASSGQGVHIKVYLKGAHVPIPANQDGLTAPAFFYPWARIHVFQLCEGNPCIPCVPL